jgi:hypothetical protein
MLEEREKEKGEKKGGEKKNPREKNTPPHTYKPPPKTPHIILSKR